MNTTEYQAKREEAIDKIHEAIQAGDHETANVIFDWILWMDRKETARKDMAAIRKTVAALNA
jgi:KaiC/GvpD/RAD55 family RecA-like ATPase